jgi:hypothetical protein
MTQRGDQARDKLKRQTGNAEANSQQDIRDQTQPTIDQRPATNPQQPATRE